MRVPSVLLLCVLLCSMLTVGCGSSTNGTIPTTPAGAGVLTSGTTNADPGVPFLWGYYDIVIEPESMTASAIVNRSLMFSLNVVKQFNSYWPSLHFDINEVVDDPEYIDVDIPIGQ